MKKVQLITLFALCIALFGCSDGGKKYLPDSKGAPYEIFVVTDKALWKGELGDTLRHVMGETIPMLNQPEPMFTLLSVPAINYENTLKRHRNIIVININAEADTTTITAAYDVSSKPQLEVTVTAPNKRDAINYISDNRSALQQIFTMAERDRLVERSKRLTNADLDKILLDKFGFQAYIPEGYNVRRDEPNFIWTSNELSMISMGIVVYQYPYEQPDQFSLDNLIKQRNSFVNKYIPGPTDGSYMTTTSIVEPVIRTLKINGRGWTEIRGFWEVENNYMGGPFISYTTLDQNTGMIVTIDNYLFSPKHPKRNYYRQLENFIFTVKFPNPTTK